MRMRHCSRVNPNNTSVADFDNYPGDKWLQALLVNVTMKSRRSKISNKFFDQHSIRGGSRMIQMTMTHG